jgi:hypothetical protein
MKKHLFLVLLTVAAAFLAVCNADNSVAEETEILELDSSPRYSISVIPEKQEDGGIIALSNTDGIVSSSPAGKVKAGTTVTLSVHPDLIAVADGSEDAEYWFVKAISGSYSMEGGPERTNVSFRPSSGLTNEWTFRMTPGDLTITVDFTRDPDETTADLVAIYTNVGAISPDFSKDKYDYTIEVPFGSTEFIVSAQAENPYLEPILQPEGGWGDNLLDLDLMAVGNGGPLSEGLSRYTISVSSGDKSASATYNISVIRLSDLSLKGFKVRKEDADFERDLAPSDTQNVYIPYVDGVTVVAEANDDSALVTIDPVTIPGLAANKPVTVTVTVSKTFSGVEASLTSKVYILNLYYGEGMATLALAEGGYVSFIPGETKSFYYEVHTFMDAGTYSLSFVDTSTLSVNADYLIVAGGGGAGGDRSSNTKLDFAGGGGAGGLLYHAGYDITLSGGSVSVVVGDGGDGGAVQRQGANGVASWIGLSESDRLLVPGGGGGGGSTQNMNGLSGGSGGGGGGGSNRAYGGGGNGPALTADLSAIDITGVLGYSGGSGGNSGGTDAGGGGGGATQAGKSANNATPGSGGAGWSPASSGETSWIYDVTNVKEFSRGGNGGEPNTSRKEGENFGDGGSAGNNIQQAGARGHSGIVIVRFRRTLES